MIEISDGDDALIFYKAKLIYIDDSVVFLGMPDSEKRYFFDIKDIQMMGIGNFDKAEIVIKHSNSGESSSPNTNRYIDEGYN